jgi:hypothetical protein
MPWTPLSSREALLQQKIGRCADQDSASTSADTFYNTHELGLLSDDALESWVTDQLNSMPEPLPGLPMRELSESEHYDTESLGWLKDNARTAEDKAFATKEYRRILFKLWRMHVAQTGETWYPQLLDDLWDRFKSMASKTSSF